MRAAALCLTALAIVSAAPANAEPATQTAQPATTTPSIVARLDVEDTELSDLIANPAAKAVIDKLMPGLTSHPFLVFMRQMTLREIQMTSSGAIPEQLLVAIDAELAKIPV